MTLPAPGVSAADLAAFAHLRRDGGWTPSEASGALSDVDTLTARGYVTTLITDMGPLVLLKHQGALAAFGRRAPSVNATRAVDLAYQRLCLQELGWEVLRVAHRGRARDTSRIERSPLVRTPDGEGYLVAQLMKGGYSMVSLRRTVEWLKGRLLYEGRQLIVLTPSAVRGRQFAELNAQVVRLVTHLPRTVPGGRDPARRLRGGTPHGSAWGVLGGADEPLITPDSRAGYALRGVPDLTLEVLSLRRPERVERARAALETDLVLSGQQLARHYGLRAADLAGMPFVEDLVTPIHNRPDGEVQAQFYLSARRLARLTGTQLAHHAGTAELRHQLGIQADRWEVVTQLKPDDQEPDAYFADADGVVVAVEYDSGAYALRKVQRKLSAFRYRGFERVLWGVPSAPRARHLTREVGVEVRVVRWFDS